MYILLHSQAGELCKRLYSDNFFLCSNKDKENIKDKKFRLLSKRLGKRIKKLFFYSEKKDQNKIKKEETKELKEKETKERQEKEEKR